MIYHEGRKGRGIGRKGRIGRMGDLVNRMMGWN